MKLKYLLYLTVQDHGVDSNIYFSIRPNPIPCVRKQNINCHFIDE